MKRIYIKILITAFIVILIILLSGTIIIINKSSKSTNIKKEKEKIHYEIKYLDKKIIYITNTLNEVYINWNEIASDMEYIYSYWNSTILDLSSIENIDKSLLTEFGNDLDDLFININHQDKNKSLYYLISLYNKLISYYQKLNYDEVYQNIINTKYNLLLANIAVNEENWTLAYEKITESDKYITNIVKSIDTNNYNQYNINQAYIAIKELENIINVKDTNIFNLKYNIAIEKLEKF